MVATFVLVDEDDRYLRYNYYPNANEAKGFGVIQIDMFAGRIDITKLAPTDYLTRQNKMGVLETCTRKELEDGKWPDAEAEEISTLFASHVVDKIVQSLEQEQVPEEGTVTWY